MPQIATTQHLAIWALDWPRHPAIVNHSEHLWATNNDGVFYRLICLVNVVALSHQQFRTDAKHYYTSQNKKQTPNPTPFIPPVSLRIMHTEIHTLNTWFAKTPITPPISTSPFHSPPHARMTHIMACIMGTWLVHVFTSCDPSKAIMIMVWYITKISTYPQVTSIGWGSMGGYGSHSRVWFL
jgi:hypothetical protein